VNAPSDDDYIKNSTIFEPPISENQEINVDEYPTYTSYASLVQNERILDDVNRKTNKEVRDKPKEEQAKERYSAPVAEGETYESFTSFKNRMYSDNDTNNSTSPPIETYEPYISISTPKSSPAPEEEYVSFATLANQVRIAS
jgi:hypothetical protein